MDPSGVISPNRDAIMRLVGAVLAEQTDEWAEGRRCLGLDILAKSRLTLVPNTTAEVTAGPALELGAYPINRRKHGYSTTRDLTARARTSKRAGPPRFCGDPAI